MSHSRRLSPLLRAFLTSCAVLVLGLAALSLAGCRASGVSTTRLNVSGSTTVLPIAETAAEMFQERNPGTSVLVAGIGSSAGIEAVANGQSEIGTSSRDLKKEELSLGLVDTPIAHDAIAVIVNPANEVSDLTKDQIARIFEGKITNWSELGGPDMAIGVVNRDEASGTREAFWKIVLGERSFDRTAAVLPGTASSSPSLEVRSATSRSGSWTARSKRWRSTASCRRRPTSCRSGIRSLASCTSSPRASRAVWPSAT
jgi:phosphate transport system substrate-binding protein